MRLPTAEQLQLTKVEVLWSRECPLACTGCAMPNPLRVSNHKIEHKGSLEQWSRAADRIATFGNPFVILYGAEALTRVEGLSHFINEIYARGLKAGIITALPETKAMQTVLNETPLDSVTVSYDAVFMDRSRKSKSTRGWKMLAANPQLADRSIVATATADNIRLLPTMARNANELGFWFFFDLLHYGSGAPSKCTDVDRAAIPSTEDVHWACDELLLLKKQGARIHASEEWLAYLRDNYNGDPRDTWHCGPEADKGVVGWISVDSDGSILPCDDWQIPAPFKIWDDDWSHEDLRRWNAATVSRCPGCAWNTDYDSVRIAAGADPKSFIHVEAGK